MKVLGIETSCDETAVAIVTDQKQIIGQQLYSQIKKHSEYGGVVPEIASRAHIEILPNLLNSLFREVNLNINDIDAVAVTTGPGLIGGLLVGLMTAKGVAHSAKKPLLAVNHLEGHALTPRLTNDVKFPYLLLLVSGGHCQILIVHGVGRYTKLGTTLDDAIGEAYDKISKMLGLGYPGGPIIEEYAKKGDIYKYIFPKSMVGREGCDFSLSGIKTAVRRIIEQEHNINEQFQCDISASFQYTIGEIIKDRLNNAFEIIKKQGINVESLVVAGGVAANKYLRNTIENIAHNNQIKFVAPPLSLCTDNAAMIAWVGVERLKLGLYNDLQIEPKATWPLESLYESVKN